MLHVSHAPQFLQGDEPIHVPPYIAYVLTLGPKFVPHTSPTFAYKTFRKALFRELPELERVLLWNAYFHNKKDADTPNTYTSLPYKKLHRSKGTLFPDSLLEDCGPASFVVPSCITHIRDSLICAFCNTKPTDLPKRGVGLCWRLLQEFTDKYVVISGDKDSSFTIMTKAAYQSEVNVHLQGTTPGGITRYVKLGSSVEDLEWWLEHAQRWMSTRHEAMSSLLPESLSNCIDTFLHMQAAPRFPNFYLLCKSHKGLYYTNGHWPSRPIVGMVQWATTTASIALSVVGTMFLNLDRLLHPQFSPLIDTLDFVNRLEVFDSLYGFASGDYAATIVDFTNMYSNFLWDDVTKTWRFWMKFFLDNHSAGTFTPQEISFAFWLFSPMPHALFEQCSKVLLFLDISYHDALTLGEFLLACMFTHTLFVAPGKGLHRQRAGFPMGTNAAAPFANLIDRYYELLCPLPTTRGFMHARFIDDLCLIHPKAWTPHVSAHLSKCYPAHLPFEIEHLGQQSGLVFLDLYLISIGGPLRFCTYFKNTNFGVYLPWRSNNPRSHKLGWIKGECARYLRTNSHKCYLDLVCDRLRSCLIRLHYPKSTYEPLPLSWSSKALYMQRKPRATMHTPIHCLRVPFHASLEFSLTGLLQWMQRKLATHIPRLRLFVTYRPMTKLRMVWHRLAMRTLRESGEGGRDGTVFLPRDLGSKNSLTPDLTAQDLLQVWARAGTPPE